MKMRVILSFLASVLIVFSFLFIAALPLSPMPFRLVNDRPAQAQLAVAPLPPVLPVAVSLAPKISEVATAPEARAEVFKCKEDGHTTYSATPCAAGAVVADYDARRATFLDASDSNSVSVARNVSGHYVARGVADGQALNFLIDTGATGVSLPGYFAGGRRIVCESFGVSRTAGGDVQTCLVTLKRLNLAGMDFYNVRANIIPTLEGEGLFGQSLLNQLKVTQSGGYMTLSR